MLEAPPTHPPEPGLERRAPDHAADPDFSIIQGGPLFRLLCKARLCDDQLGLARRRIAVIALLSWLPLAALSALDGNLLPGRVTMPFAFDFQANLRFLAAMPLLIGVELVFLQRLPPMVQQFRCRNLIPDHAVPRYEAAMASAIRWRDSTTAEILMLALVFSVGIPLHRYYLKVGVPAWYNVAASSRATPTPAGLWYGLVSLPIFQFLLLRWYFRLFIWTRFLWQVSRMELRLVPLHPDRAGGLGFLSQIAFVAAPLAVAHSVLLAGALANRIFYLGAKLTAFKAEIAVVVAFSLCLLLGPLLVFTPQLIRTKWAGEIDFGSFAARYTREFDQKWLRGRAAESERLLGTSDIQSLADLSNSGEIVRGMRLALITRDSIFTLAFATLAPIVPLVLTMMPLEQLLKTLLGLLF